MENEQKILSFQQIKLIAFVYLRELLKFSWLVLLLSALLGYALYSMEKKNVPIYTATLSFSMNQSGSELQRGLLGIIGGFSEGSGSETGMSKEQLTELIQTRKIIKMTLFDSISIASKKDLFINHYIDLQGIRSVWEEEDRSIKDFRFTHNNFTKFTITENSIFLSIYNTITKGQFIIDPSLTSLLFLKFSSKNEQLSFEFINSIYTKVDSFYFDLARSKQKQILDAAITRTATIKEKMNFAERKYIDYSNKNNAASGGRFEKQIRTQFLARNLQNAIETYFLALNNEELAKVSYESQSNVLQLIDPPIYPLPVTRPKPFIYLILGGIIGGIIGTFIVIAQKLIRDFLKKGKFLPEAEEEPEPSLEEV